jgi:basic membrane protein A
MNRKVLTSMFIGIFLLLSVYSVGQTYAVSVSPQQTFKVGIVYSTGGLGDQSFNDAAKRGIDAALASHSTLTVEESCEVDCTIPDITTALGVMAGDDSFDLIIGIGFSAADGVTAAATAAPGTNFMIIDAFINMTNVASIEFKEEEGSFLVGAMAGMVTETNALGFIGGLDIPLINRFAAGFEHGARTINNDITVQVTYAPDPNNPWGDLAGGKTIGESMIAEGIDIIFAAAGGTGVGMFTAVEEANDGGATTYAIGVDSDQDGISAGNVLTSMIKKVDVAVEGNIDELVAGTWAAGGQKLGLAEDGVGISAMTYTQAEANGDYKGDKRIDKVNELKQKIIDGDIVVADTLDVVDDRLAEQSSSDDSPLPILPFIAGFIGMMVIYRKFRYDLK